MLNLEDIQWVGKFFPLWSLTFKIKNPISPQFLKQIQRSTPQNARATFLYPFHEHPDPFHRLSTHLSRKTWKFPKSHSVSAFISTFFALLENTNDTPKCSYGSQVRAFCKLKLIQTVFKKFLFKWVKKTGFFSSCNPISTRKMRPIPDLGFFPSKRLLLPVPPAKIFRWTYGRKKVLDFLKVKRLFF